MGIELDFEGTIKKLEPRKGGYLYVGIGKSEVVRFQLQHRTRLLCTLENALSFPCAFLSKGDGSFYILISKARARKLGKSEGDSIQVHIQQHPEPLGVSIPEVLEVFLAQDPDARKVYEQLTDGKKRSLLFTIDKIKNIDSQVHKIQTFLEQENIRMRGLR